jgi:hypothetical protein
MAGSVGQRVQGDVLVHRQLVQLRARLSGRASTWRPPSPAPPSQPA